MINSEPDSYSPQGNTPGGSKTECTPVQSIGFGPRTESRSKERGTLPLPRQQTDGLAESAKISAVPTHISHGRGAIGPDGWHPKDRTARDERKSGCGWDEHRMFTTYAEAITLPVGDDENRTVDGEILGPFEQIDARLQNGAASTTNPNAPGNVVRRQPSDVVRGGVTKDDPDIGDLAGGAVARDRTKGRVNISSVSFSRIGMSVLDVDHRQTSTQVTDQGGGGWRAQCSSSKAPERGRSRRRCDGC